MTTLLNFVPGPDFPHAVVNIVLNPLKTLQNAYRTAKVLSAAVPLKTEDLGRGAWQIVIKT